MTDSNYWGGGLSINSTQVPSTTTHARLLGVKLSHPSLLSGNEQETEDRANADSSDATEASW